MSESILEHPVENLDAKTTLAEPGPLVYLSKNDEYANLNWEIMDALLLNVSRAREGIKIHCELIPESIFIPLDPMRLFELISRLLDVVLRVADQDPSRSPRRLEIQTGRHTPERFAYMQIRICRNMKQGDPEENLLVQKECRAYRDLEKALQALKQELQTLDAELNGPTLNLGQQSDWEWSVSFPTIQDWSVRQPLSLSL